MAKVNQALYSMAAKGAIAKTLTIKRVRGKVNVAQRYAYPGSAHKITESAAQAIQRKHYTTMVTAWRALSLADQSTWRIKARHLGMSGWNLYYKSYVPPHDPYWANVESLLHFDGADGSSVIVDAAGAAWTNTSPALLSSVQSVFGGTSLDTTGSAGIDNDVSPTSDWMAADWTWEARLYCTDTTLHVMPWIVGIDTTDKVGLMLYLGVWWLIALTGISLGIAVTQGVWMAVALQNKAGKLELYLNGALVYTVAMPVMPVGATKQVLGNYIDLAAFNGPWPGYIDESRLTIGVARLVDGYTPTTTEFLND